MTNEEAKEARKRLAAVVTDWEPDGCHPANYVRRDGLGTEIARVDRWCGGFQDCTNPVTIGFRVRVATQCGGFQVEEGVLIVADYDDVDDAIGAAMEVVDATIPGVARSAGKSVEVISTLAPHRSDAAADTAAEAFTL
jgi:hypothetical protein